MYRRIISPLPVCIMETLLKLRMSSSTLSSCKGVDAVCKLTFLGPWHLRAMWWRRLVGWLVHPFHAFILPWPTPSRVSTSHVYRRNYNLAFSSWISSYHTECRVWMSSVLLRIWHVLGSNTGCAICSSAWLKTPLPLPPDCQSVWYCSYCCVDVCPPTNRCAQITESWRLNFVPWHLMFVGTRYRPCFMSTLWRLECGCGCCSFGKSVQRSLPIIDRLTLHFTINTQLHVSAVLSHPQSVTAM